MEPLHKGKFIVIVVTTGDYEIADDDLEASDRMVERNPDAILYGTRIGERAAYRIGAHFGTASRRSMAMRGRVTADAREAAIAVQVLGAHCDRAEIEAVIDTGFIGFLTLPADLVRSLSLPLRGSRDVVLADGSVVGLDV